MLFVHFLEEWLEYFPYFKGKVTLASMQFALAGATLLL